MRKSADWMAHVDERILEFLSEYGNHQPSQIATRLEEIGAGMEYHPNYVGRRCRTLTDYGLLRNIGNGVYQITDEGEQYLAGELDTSGLQ
jgi:predicted transcriptional regulator